MFIEQFAGRGKKQQIYFMKTKTTYDFDLAGVERQTDEGR